MTGASILVDAFDGLAALGGALRGAADVGDVPRHGLACAAAQPRRWTTVEALAEERAALLERDERLLHNVSHELRTPVTITRGHLELLERRLGEETPELHVAFDELGANGADRRADSAARARRAAGVGSSADRFRSSPFLEDVFMRWAEVAPRAWRLGSIVDVTLDADETWLRAALDAILENAVHHTEPYAAIDLSAHGDCNDVVIVVTDGGDGIPATSLEQIFERFARTDDSRSRREGGAGLGLAIVAAIARAHGGSCSAHNVAGGRRLDRTATASPAGGAGRRASRPQVRTSTARPEARLESA